jgi:hypothetical protein
VISSFLTRIAFIVAVISVSATPASAWPHKQVQKARVRFLASSTLIRGTWGLNEDTYLAELHVRQDNESILIRLVDEYPNEAPPLSKAVLTSESGTTLRVRRDSQCDSAYSRMLLRASPGDLMAILPVKLEYQPILPERIEPNSVLRCYRTIRR